MTDVDKLKEDELNQLNGVEVEAEEVGLEDLIILGEDKKIPIHITYPKTDGTRAKAKALVKQLTLKELDSLNFNRNNPGKVSLLVLRKALFKQNGDNFTDKELEMLPLGVVNAISNKILELSGVEVPNTPDLADF